MLALALLRLFTSAGLKEGHSVVRLVGGNLRFFNRAVVFPTLVLAVLSTPACQSRYGARRGGGPASCGGPWPRHPRTGRAAARGRARRRRSRAPHGGNTPRSRGGTPCGRTGSPAGSVHALGRRGTSSGASGRGCCPTPRSPSPAGGCRPCPTSRRCTTSSAASRPLARRGRGRTSRRRRTLHDPRPATGRRRSGRTSGRRRAAFHDARSTRGGSRHGTRNAAGAASDAAGPSLTRRGRRRAGRRRRALDDTRRGRRRSAHGGPRPH